MTPTTRAPATALGTVLEAICDAQPFVTRYQVRDLRSGDDWCRGEREQTPSGSTRKTSIMMAALSAAGQGRLDLRERIVYEERHAHEVASGVFRHLTPGIVITLEDAIRGMMVLSDNVCTNMVFERLTLTEVDAYCKSIGMLDTHHRFLIPPLALDADHALDAVTVTTAADHVLLMQAILDAQACEAAAAQLKCSVAQCRFALDTLRRQVLRYGIASRVPMDTVIASKSGRGKRGRMDTGIVYMDGGPRFIIAAYTDQVPQLMPDGTPGYTLALETIGRLAQASWLALR